MPARNKCCPDDLRTSPPHSARGRVVVMTGPLHVLLSAKAVGKKSDCFVFTREDGTRVADFRESWAKACIAAGLGKWVCVRGRLCFQDGGSLTQVTLTQERVSNSCSQWGERDAQARS